jgi:hypothetical protein
MKTCSKCKKTKSIDSFSKDNSRKDKLNPWCKECTRESNKNADAVKSRARGAAWYQANKVRHAAKTKRWFAANPGKSAAYSAKWRAANPGRQSECDKDWYARNRAKRLAEDKARREADLAKYLRKERAQYEKTKVARLARHKIWAQNNPHKINQYASERRSARIDRTPPWLTPEHNEAILDYFKEAARLRELTGRVHHVDHIVPLRGKNVSGLHVPWNMQVLEGTENLRKNNRHES